jgi:hypothetical protein
LRIVVEMTVVMGKKKVWVELGKMRGENVNSNIFCLETW